MPDAITTGSTRRRRRTRPGSTGRLLAVSLALFAGAGGTAASQSSPPVAASGDVSKATEPVDFKLGISFYGVRQEPITTAELVVRKGNAYYFASEEPEEVLIFDPTAARLELLDLKRKIQAEIPLAKLDHKQAVLHRAITYSIRDREDSGTRADRIAAAMSRALIDPGLSETYDSATQHLRLTNSVVTVEAVGAPEPDSSRLSLIDASLSALIKLAAVRDPKAIPPFIRLDALHALTLGHRLRPTELSFVYRLAGPPRKHGWTYRLVPSLTEREVEAIRRIVLLRERTPYTPFERYEEIRRSKGGQ